MYYIDYKGKNYPARDIDNVPGFEDEGTVTVAEYSLWEAMEKDYNNDDAVANDLDGQIFAYLHYGFLTNNPTDDELRSYLDKILN